MNAPIDDAVVWPDPSPLDTWWQQVVDSRAKTAEHDRPDERDVERREA
ncbi:hypothetical protein [Rhodococcus sp. HNM0569]|nr:hypothetical protein [Rhodococcus sp. HNM0569]NLU82966.1 hypothetical protein [Rhodococcus sp. HNM0569]